MIRKTILVATLTCFSESEEEILSDDFDDDDEDPVERYDITKKRTTVELAQELLELIEVYGTKMGNLIYYLRRLWEQTPDARVIIFSQVTPLIFKPDILVQPSSGRSK